MYFNEEVLVEGEVVPVKGKLIKKVEQVEQEYEVSFDFYNDGGNTSNWDNLVHFTTQDTNTGADGHYIPCVHYYNKQLLIYSSVNGRASYYHGTVNFTPNVWHSLVIRQEKVENDYVYSITLDGQNIHQISNTQTKVYNDVKVYVSDPWNNSAGGKIKNLKLCNGEKVDPELQCPHCQKLFSDPILLDCGDTLCKACVEKLVVLEGTATCPVCQLATVTDSTALWRNEVIQRKVDAGKGGTIKCDDCEKGVAKEFCYDCRAPFCSDCADHHRKRARSEKHKISDITTVPEHDLQQSPVPFCEKHGKLLEYFCEQCKTVTCNDCSRSKAHRGHDMLLMDEVLEEELSSLEKLLAEIHEKWNKYEECVINIEKFMSLAGKKKEKSRIAIQETFNKIRQELQAAEEESLKWLDKPYEAAMDALQQAKDSLAKGKGKTRYIDDLAALPSKGESGSMIEAKKWVEETCKQLGAVLLNEKVGEGNIYDLSRELIVSHEVSSVDKDGAGVVEMMLNGAKKISFQQIIVRYCTADASGTF